MKSAYRNQNWQASSLQVVGGSCIEKKDGKRRRRPTVQRLLRRDTNRQNDTIANLFLQFWAWLLASCSVSHCHGRVEAKLIKFRFALLSDSEVDASVSASPRSEEH